MLTLKVSTEIYSDPLENYLKKQQQVIYGYKVNT